MQMLGVDLATIQSVVGYADVDMNNEGVMNNIAAINEAMSRHIDGEPHTPEKITFKYLK